MAAIAVCVVTCACGERSGAIVGSEPSRAFVHVDGKLVGRTPVNVGDARHAQLFLPGSTPEDIALSPSADLIVRPLVALSAAVPASQRAEAWRLLVTAIDAAGRAGCPGVAELGAKIRSLDPAVYALVFVRERSIASCRGERVAP